MIAILLILAAAGCLAAGLLLDSLLYSYVALGTSGLAGLILIVATWRCRRQATDSASKGSESADHDEQNPTESTTETDGDMRAEADSTEPGRDEGDESAEAAETDTTVVGESDPAESPTTSDEVSGADDVTGAEVPATAPDAATSVVVVPGRRRYHRSDCELVAEAVAEEITIADAADEGFSACTMCTPNAITAERS